MKRTLATPQIDICLATATDREQISRLATMFTPRNSANLSRKLLLLTERHKLGATRPTESGCPATAFGSLN
jgi:hypothetical protein